MNIFHSLTPSGVKESVQSFFLAAVPILAGESLPGNAAQRAEVPPGGAYTSTMDAVQQGKNFAGLAKFLSSAGVDYLINNEIARRVEEMKPWNNLSPEKNLGNLIQVSIQKTPEGFNVLGGVSFEGSGVSPSEALIASEFRPGIGASMPLSVPPSVNDSYFLWAEYENGVPVLNKGNYAVIRAITLNAMAVYEKDPASFMADRVVARMRFIGIEEAYSSVSQDFKLNLNPSLNEKTIHSILDRAARGKIPVEDAQTLARGILAKPDPGMPKLLLERLNNFLRLDPVKLQSVPETPPEQLSFTIIDRTNTSAVKESKEKVRQQPSAPLSPGTDLSGYEFKPPPSDHRAADNFLMRKQEARAAAERESERQQDRLVRARQEGQERTKRLGSKTNPVTDLGQIIAELRRSGATSAEPEAEREQASDNGEIPLLPPRHGADNKTGSGKDHAGEQTNRPPPVKQIEEKRPEAPQAKPVEVTMDSLWERYQDEAKKNPDITGRWSNKESLWKEWQDYQKRDNADNPPEILP